MKNRDWIFDDESSGAYVSMSLEKDKLDPSEYQACIRINDEHNTVTYSFFIGSPAEKTQTLHDVRRLKKSISDFYNEIKAIPDEDLGEEIECSDVKTVEK